jgi:hypothetical protein
MFVFTILIQINVILFSHFVIILFFKVYAKMLADCGIEIFDIRENSAHIKLFGQSFLTFLHKTLKFIVIIIIYAQKD